MCLIYSTHDNILYHRNGVLSQGDGAQSEYRFYSAAQSERGKIHRQLLKRL